VIAGFLYLLQLPFILKVRGMNLPADQTARVAVEPSPDEVPPNQVPQ
jgi:hypothetical protein